MSEHDIQQNPASHPEHGIKPHAEHHGHAPAASPFSEEEWKEFRKSDIGAGGAVVVLMTAIFSIGLVLYTIIAIVVAA